MDLLHLEQQRHALEQSLQTLRTSLKQWQTWEAEYEGLKEEIASVGDALDDAALHKLSQEYDGELVNEREIRDLTGLTHQSPRTASQIIGLISHRQEYVQKNIDTIQRRFWDNESKLEELDFAAFSAATRNSDAGLPLTEIHEELDDDDNVVSSSTSHPESASVQLIDTLRKAGLADEDILAQDDIASAKQDLVPSSKASSRSQPRSISPKKRTEASVDDGASAGDSSHDDESGPERPTVRKKSVSFSADTKLAPEPVRRSSEEGKKSVSFADKVAIARAAPLPDPRSVSFSPKVEEIPAQPLGPSESAVNKEAEIQKTLRTHFKPGDKVIEVNDDDEVEAMHIVMPKDESLEDAQMRREMLEYHLNEVGHVVAQIDLNEDDGYGDGDESASASDFTSSEYQDEDTPYTSGGSEEDEDEDEDEDEYGRTRGRVLTDDYHKQMRELERHLIGNLGPAPSDQDITALDPDLDPREVHRLVIREERSSMSSANSDDDKRSSSKKRVSFAEAIDVADTTSSPFQANEAVEDEPAALIKDTITERPKSESQPITMPDNSRKASRFKQARTVSASHVEASVDDLDDMDDGHSGPSDQVVAEQLVERPAAAKLTAPPSADTTTPLMQHRQFAADYYRRRNDIIREQGGFKHDPDDEDLGEMMEERDGKLKKMSRFKAARIRS